MLSVCATPIGNLEDVTLRVLRELAEAELVLCEDTRHTRRLLERHGIRARLRSYHEHNEAARTAEILPRLETGERIALVTDAGLPGISDPGARLVGAALDAGVPVTVLPGPSAVDTALVASGFAAERYQFVGFLPRGEQGLRRTWEELSPWPWPAVAFESPRRLPATLRSLASADPDRPMQASAASPAACAGTRRQPQARATETAPPTFAGAPALRVAESRRTGSARPQNRSRPARCRPRMGPAEP